ncbi:MAG: hypothetical protein QOH31_3106 [Verrucomicrobiota bacterium]|jgi:hypothetical protein
MARLECMFKIKVTAARTLWRRRTARERNVVCLVAMLSGAIWRSGKQWSLGEESRSRWLGLSCRCDDRSQGFQSRRVQFYLSLLGSFDPQIAERRCTIQT